MSSQAEPEPLLRAFKIQARTCDDLDAGFQAALSRQIAEAVAAGDRLEDLFEPWAARSVSQLFADHAPLRLLAALHDLVLSGDAPELARAYPSAADAGDPAAAWLAARLLLSSARERIAAFMTHEPQTNEVRRSACLLGGFLAIAQETTLPLRTFELGASAGLNLYWDRFGYRLGPHRWGDPASPVQIDCDWSGPAPALAAPVKVASRAACDRSPPNIADPAQRRRLLAYIWPGQLDRFARIEAAMQVALQAGVRVEAADAAAWAATAAAPAAGAATVVYH